MIESYYQLILEKAGSPRPPVIYYHYLTMLIVMMEKWKEGVRICTSREKLEWERELIIKDIDMFRSHQI